MAGKWFKNKETGNVWNVTDKEVIKRLSDSEDYTEVKDPTSKKKSGSKKKKSK